MTTQRGKTSNLAIILSGPGGTALTSRVEAYLLDRGMKQFDGPWIDHTDWTKKQLEKEADFIDDHGGEEGKEFADKIRNGLNDAPEGITLNISGEGFTVIVVITGPNGESQTLTFEGDNYLGLDEAGRLAAVNRFVDQILDAIAGMSSSRPSTRRL